MYPLLCQQVVVDPREEDLLAHYMVQAAAPLASHDADLYASSKYLYLLYRRGTEGSVGPLYSVFQQETHLLEHNSPS